MSRLVFLLVVFSWALSAATPTLSQVKVVPAPGAEGRAFTVQWSTSEAVSNSKAKVCFDFEGDDVDYCGIEATALDGNPRRARDITSAIPSSNIYVIPRSRDASTNWSVDFQCPSLTCTNCGSADNSFFADNSGLDCTPGAYPKRTMPALETCTGGPPCEPTAPTHTGLTACPAITGTTRNVLGDGSDFLEQFNDAKTDAAAGTVEAVALPPGVAIRPEDQTGDLFQFSITTGIANGGWVVIKSQADPKLLPPPGSRTDPTFFPHMGRIEFNTDPRDWDAGVPIFEGGSSTRGYCFENVLVTSPPPADLPVLTFPITAIDTSTNVLTTSGSLAAVQNGTIVHVDLIPSGVQGGNGPRKLCSISGSTFQLSTLFDGSFSCGGIQDLTGSNCASNCGTAQHWSTKAIEAVSNTTPIELTITAHNLPNFPPNTITGSSAATNVTVASTNGSMHSNAVYIEGTGISTCDGTWIASVSGSTVTLSPRQGSSTPAVCTGATVGTIQRVGAISVHRTSNETLGGVNPKQYAYYSSDADSVILLDSSALGAGITGGYIFSQNQRAVEFIRVAGTGGTLGPTDIVLDRVAIVYDFPWESGFPVLITRSEHWSFVNGWIENHSWRRENPVSGVLETTGISGSGGIDNVAGVIYPQASNDNQIRNNWFGRDPMIYGETPSTDPWKHTTIAQNIFWTPSIFSRTHSAFEGLDHGHTFCIEAKDADTMAIVGNFFKGCWSNRGLSLATIEFSGIGSTGTSLFYTKDVRIAHNTIEQSAAGIQFISDGTDASRIHGPLLRVLVDNNLVVEGDSIAYQGDDASITGGKLFFHTGNIVDVILRRNTFWPHRAHESYPWMFGGAWSSGGVAEDNIFLATEGSFDRIGGFVQYTSSSRIPAPVEGEGTAAINEFWLRGNSSDPLTDMGIGNIIVSGVENSPGGFTAKLPSAADADTKSRNEAETDPRLDVVGNTFVGNATACSAGTCPDSLAQRADLTFQSGTYRPTATYSSKGTDLDAAADAQGWVTGITATVDSDSITLSWHAPSTTGCHAQIGRFDTDWMMTFGATNLANISSWTQDTSSSQSQSVTFNSVPQLTKHYYRIGCVKFGIGEVTTGQ